jgi:hypothetical protein
VIHHTHTCNADDAEISETGFSPKIVKCVMHLIIGIAAGFIAIGGVAIYLALA